MKASADLTQPQIATDKAFHFGYFPQLDGLRGLSILFVLVAHTFLDKAGALGGLGVMLFFVLSGFLITGLLWRESESFGRIGIKFFYARRALRILPAFLVFMAVCSVLVARGFITDVRWYTVAVSCLYLNNIFGSGLSLSHLWSLSLEEQFYLIWPLAISRLGRRWTLPVASLVALAIVAARGVAIRAHLFQYYSAVFYERPWFRFDSILAGCCLALLLARSKETAASTRRIATWAPSYLTLPLAVLWTLYADGMNALHPIYLTVQMLWTVLALAHIATSPDSAISPLLSTRGMKYLGHLSYSLYLWQQIFLVTKSPNWGWIRHFPFSLLASLCAALTFYYLIEKPFLRWKSTFERNRIAAARERSQRLPQIFELEASALEVATES
ncbi:MAG TPA: acyltransferase family protein [Terriglobales bacterium]|nr:acyltransferase family protein [Terriglobales bacterium]